MDGTHDGQGEALKYREGAQQDDILGVRSTIVDCGDDCSKRRNEEKDAAEDT